MVGADISETEAAGTSGKASRKKRHLGQLLSFFLGRLQEQGACLKEKAVCGPPGLSEVCLSTGCEYGAHTCTHIGTGVCRHAAHTHQPAGFDRPRDNISGKGLSQEKTGNTSPCSSLPQQPRSLSALREHEMGWRRAGRCVMLRLFPDVLPSAPGAAQLSPPWLGGG